MTIEVIRKLNFQRLVEQYGSQGRLARALDVTVGYVHQLNHGIRNIGERSAANMERKLNLPHGWLSTPEEGQEGLDPEPPPAPPQKMIPVLAWDNCPHNLATPIETIPTAWQTGQSSFALYVDTDATSPHIPMGSYVVVSPDRSAKIGDFIVFRIERHSPVAIRQYIEEGGVKYLKSANPIYPLIVWSDQEVVGIVTYFQKKLT